MKKITTKDKLLLSLSALILVAIAIFLIRYRNIAYSLAEKMLRGVDLVEEYIHSLGLIGITIMILIMIFCFFFPMISSIPVQIACGITYGILGGSAIAMLALILATQLLYLFRQNLKVFSSPKQIQKRKELEKMIAESDRNLYFALLIAYLLPAVPYLVISNLAASGLNYRKYTLVTVLGMIPDLVCTIFLGEKMLSTSPIASIITLIVMVIVITLSIIFNDKLLTWVFAPKKKKGTADSPSQDQ